MYHLSGVGSPDDDMGVEGVELCRKHGALRRQLVLRSVLHRHRPVLYCIADKHIKLDYNSPLTTARVKQGISLRLSQSHPQLHILRGILYL